MDILIQIVVQVKDNILLEIFYLWFPREILRNLTRMLLVVVRISDHLANQKNLNI